MDHREISAKGGRAGRGKVKARSSKQARSAALARWRHGDGAVGKSIEQAIVDEKDDRTELPEDAKPMDDDAVIAAGGEPLGGETFVEPREGGL